VAPPRLEHARAPLVIVIAIVDAGVVGTCAATSARVRSMRARATHFRVISIPLTLASP
jgi:hypothetical protein